MDVVLQIFKQSICLSMSFFKSLTKKPPVTMDDLFKQVNKYSMLEDDVTQPHSRSWSLANRSRMTRLGIPKQEPTKAIKQEARRTAPPGPIQSYPLQHVV
ncbi:hypothetical protein CK203_116729 [Vitis vinifera]|uniref:Uncharacterized protein n=1 Tax=Vitis vinifera TaxID=29760 RepID=A0A438CQS4_VITVI|nr:hypothetical protein CK203_116729 [Vitis vinifera]